MANMLLLIKDVDSLGKKGEIVKARPGYFRNFLLPQGLAIIADKHTLRWQARLQEERAQQAAADKKESEEQKSRLEQIELSTTVKVDQEGHMYGSVSAQDIVELLASANGMEIEKRAVQLKHAIKTIGTHTLVLKLKEGVTASLKLNVLPEGGLPQATTAPEAPKA